MPRPIDPADRPAKARPPRLLPAAAPGTFVLFGALLSTASPNAIGGAPPAAPPRAQSARAPVLVELFTSEGCSSCPPADELLAELAKSGTVEDTPLVALELHVDYWNYLGWRDPFSDAAYSNRQAGYVRWLRGRGPYTPQLIVAGRYDVLGSDGNKARAAILNASESPAPSASLALSLLGDRVRIAASDLPRRPTTLWGALTESGLQTKVLRGENGGRTLRHGPVVRWMQALGHSDSGRISADVPLHIEAAWQRPALQAVVFAQDDASGHIVSVTAASLAPTSVKP